MGILQSRRASAASPLGGTGKKDPEIWTFFTSVFRRPRTVNTMPESTLKAVAERRVIGTRLPADHGNCEEILTQFVRATIDVGALGVEL